MTKEKEARVEELRFRFQDLSGQLERIHREWIDAREQNDVGREVRLIGEETDLFNEVNKVITEFTELMHHDPRTG